MCYNQEHFAWFFYIFFLFLNTMISCSVYYCKVDSVQEACAKCFAVHILKFEIWQITWKKWNTEYQTLLFQFFTNRFSILLLFVLFFRMVCKISNFNKWKMGASFLYWDDFIYLRSYCCLLIFFALLQGQQDQFLEFNGVYDSAVCTLFINKK